jgi:hypothetical protein
MLDYDLGTHISDNETLAYFNHSITYHHGWSFIFNVVTFTLLPIHQWKPWLPGFYLYYILSFYG